MTKKDKVYCQDCQYYRSFYDNCGEPSNLKDNYKKPAAEYIQSPVVLNSNNDCVKWMLSFSLDSEEIIGGCDKKSLIGFWNKIKKFVLCLK